MIFDTDVPVWASRGNPAAANVINRTADRVLSIVSFMELLQGARSKLEARQIRQFLRELRFHVLPLSGTIGDAAAAIVEQHALSHGIQLADALIAATVIEAADQLCTANVKHFRPVGTLSLVAFRP